MSRIALLPEEVASQVAAGEVVERPASVIKELVENSLDAEADRIEVHIRQGGISYLRVVDNGIGMDRQDALLCLERHATSKIRTGHDLAAICTLGFRGEALPSIASVSRFRLTTRPHDALAGTEVIVAGGRIESVLDGGDAPGTQIEVRSLFYNLPARRKFLRTENTESSHIEHQLHVQAIGHPGTGFVFVNNERLVYQVPPTAHLLERIRDLCGPAMAADLIEVPVFESNGFKIHGYLGRPGVSRSSRQQQLVFLNGRVVENSTLSFALREGYHTALIKGQHPVTFLFIEMDPAAVDVNVHPAKREVRFRDSASVRDVVIEAVRVALERVRPGSALRLPSVEVPAALLSADVPPLIPPAEQVALRHDWSEFPGTSPTELSFPPQPSQPAQTAQPSQPAQTAQTAQTAHASQASLASQASELAAPSDFRMLGVLGRQYILMENSSGLVLVDQRAAHERILFEEMRLRMEQQGVPSQRLLLPLTLQVTPKDADWLMRNLDVLERAGIGLELFGPNTFKIDCLPTFLRSDDPAQLVREIIDELRDTSLQTSKLRLGEEMIAKTVCRHAVRANDLLQNPELLRLIEDLMACELPYCCPLGRPTMIQMSYPELEKKFGRKL